MYNKQKSQKEETKG